MNPLEVQHIIDRVLRYYPDTAQSIKTMLDSFSYSQLEEYARVAKAVLGF